jgi:hypothetical protein
MTAIRWIDYFSYLSRSRSGRRDESSFLAWTKNHPSQDTLSRGRRAKRQPFGLDIPPRPSHNGHVYADWPREALRICVSRY